MPIRLMAASLLAPVSSRLVVSCRTPCRASVANAAEWGRRELNTRRRLVFCSAQPPASNAENDKDKNDKSQEQQPYPEPIAPPPAASFAASPEGRDAIMAELDRALSGEESKALWADLESAALRVSRARASYEEMEKKEKELLALKAELEAAALMEAELAQADAQVSGRYQSRRKREPGGMREDLGGVEKLEAEVAAAEQAARAAGAALIEARAGGGFRTSSAGSGEQTAGKWAVSTGTIDDDKERVESAKAATVAAVAGTVAGLPFLLSQRAQEGGTGLSFLVAAAALAATCALFGVTYRYIVRKDMGNIHLKAGAVGAFGLARGLAQVDSTFSLVSAGSANNGLSDDVMGSMTDGALVPVALSLLEAGEGVLVLALTATHASPHQQHRGSGLPGDKDELSRNFPVDDIVQHPLPGYVSPSAIAFSPDDQMISYLFSEEGTLTRKLFAYELKTGQQRLLVAPPGGGVDEDNLSMEEKLRRERQRERGLGITRYDWSKNVAVPRIMIPLPDGVYVQDGMGADLRLRIPGGASPILDPQISPDGSAIAFVRDDELFVVSTTAGAPRQLTFGAKEANKVHGLAEYIAQSRRGAHQIHLIPSLNPSNPHPSPSPLPVPLFFPPSPLPLLHSPPFPRAFSFFVQPAPSPFLPAHPLLPLLLPSPTHFSPSHLPSYSPSLPPPWRVQEEMERRSGFWWAHDSTRIAFTQSDPPSPCPPPEEMERRSGFWWAHDSTRIAFTQTHEDPAHLPVQTPILPPSTPIPPHSPPVMPPSQEEMERRSGFWWAHDSTRIAFTQTDASAVPLFRIPHCTRPPVGADSEEEHAYPFAATSFHLSPFFCCVRHFNRPRPFVLPFPGQANVSVRLGVVPVAGGEVRWMDLHCGLAGSSFGKTKSSSRSGGINSSSGVRNAGAGNDGNGGNDGGNGVGDGDGVRIGGGTGQVVAQDSGVFQQGEAARTVGSTHEGDAGNLPGRDAGEPALPEKEASAIATAGSSGSGNGTAAAATAAAATAATAAVDDDDDDEEYLARVSWLPDGRLSAQVQNRRQTRLKLLRFDPTTGSRDLVLTETNPLWVNLHDCFTPLVKSGGELRGGFLWASERTGFRHLYLYAGSGRCVGAVTAGEWMVEQVAGLDEGAGLVYFTGTMDSALESHLYVTSLFGGVEGAGGGAGLGPALGADKRDAFSRYEQQQQQQQQQMVPMVLYSVQPTATSSPSSTGAAAGVASPGLPGSNPSAPPPAPPAAATALHAPSSSLAPTAPSSLPPARPIRLTQGPGRHLVVLDHSLQRFVDLVDSLDSPPAVRLCCLASGRVLAVIFQQHSPNPRVQRLQLRPPELVEVTAADGTTLHGAIYRAGCDLPVSTVFGHSLGRVQPLGNPPSGRMLAVIFQQHSPNPRMQCLQLRLPELVQVTAADGTTLHGAIYRSLVPPELMQLTAADGTALLGAISSSRIHCSPLPPCVLCPDLAIFGPPPYRTVVSVPDPAIFGPPPYRTVVSVYGGPHVQTVCESWLSTVDMRAQFLRARGMLVWKLDNRGSSRRGLAFEGAIKCNMGGIDADDQAAGVRWLIQQGLADPNRIGIYGWSYGGYLSAMCLARYPSLFRCAISGAPVTAWDGYDTHYTERYMGLPAEQPTAYDRSSVMRHVGGIRGKLLLVHGMIDENVHFRHSVRLVQALTTAAKQYELLLFPEERHMPRGLRDRTYMEERIYEFLTRCLS
ncbi:unnamed protein product [Closterium sp. NIES-65]|nr:unnamed protein product [Closterium sp. NIES-65]